MRAPGAVSGGNGWYDTVRRLEFGGFRADAQSDHDVSHFGGQVRAAVQVGRGRWYAKPIVDLLLDPHCPPVCWLGTGQRVPEDLEAAEAGPIVRSLFGAAA